MSRNTNLDSHHYAAEWTLPKSNEMNSLSIVNQAGIDYAISIDGLEKEDKLLNLLKCFHPYIMKYVDLIVRHHKSTYKQGKNSDTKAFLRYFISKEDINNKNATDKAIKNLHLAFPNESATDIYDILVSFLLKAVHKFDPYYSNKILVLVKVLDKISKKTLITVDDISKDLDFDPRKQLRLLMKHNFLKAIKDKKGKLLGYKKRKWPPNKKFLTFGPIGFSYVIQTLFRNYLKGYMRNRMLTIEAQGWDKMLQLSHAHTDEGFAIENTPDANGIEDEKGSRWGADTTLIRTSFDLSSLTLSWTKNTDDKLFRNMTILERRVLYYYYTQEWSWKKISISLKMTIPQVQKIHNQILLYLRSKFGVKKEDKNVKV